MNVQFAVSYHAAGCLPDSSPETFEGDDVAEVLAKCCSSIIDDVDYSGMFEADQTAANAVCREAKRQLVLDPRRFAAARSGFVIADATTGGYYRWSVEPVSLPQGAARRSAA